MKKAARKFVSSVIIIILACAAVFVLGWTNLYVNPGEYGVIVSKTSGMYNKCVVSGKFTWKWERLIPTNVSIRTFSLSPYKTSQTVSGSLPSASVYSAHMDDHPDFSYRVDMNIGLCIDEEGLLYLVKSHDLKNQDDLDAYLESRARLVAQRVMDYILENRDEDTYITLQSLNQSQIQDITDSNKSDFKNLVISSVDVVSAHIPDFEMYSLAKQSFVSYQEALNQSMEQRIQEQAEKRVEEDRTIEQLEKFAILLGKYPQLEDLSKNGNINEIINTLRSLKN